MLVSAMECIACSLDRERWNFEGFAIWRDTGDAGGDYEANVAELTQFFDCPVDFLCIISLGIWNRFRVVKDDNNFLRGYELSEGGQVLWIFDPSSNDLRQSAQKIGT